MELPRAGKYNLAAAARGFHTQLYEAHDGHFSAIVLTDATPTYYASLRLAPDSLISGVVRDDVGDPVANAQVSAELIPPLDPDISAAAVRPRPVAFSNTDDLGQYELNGLAPGTYHVKVNQATPWYAVNARGMGRIQPVTSPPAQPWPEPSLDYIFPTTYFPGSQDESKADSIQLGAGEDRQADFHLTAIPAVHLIVPRTDAVPGQGTTYGGSNTSPDELKLQRQAQAEASAMSRRPATIMRVSGDGNNFGSSLSSTVNRDGSSQWDFGGLAPGIYEVTVPRPGAATGAPADVRRIEVRAGSPPIVTMESAIPLTKVKVVIDGVSDSEVSSIEFVDTETGHRTMSAPASRGRRGMRMDEGPPEDLVAEDQPVRSRMVSLAPHRYEVYLGGNSGVFLTGISATGATVSGRTIDIAAGSPVLTLHVLSGRGDLSGIATDAGKPALAALVLLVPASLGEPGNLRTIERQQTNTDGSFEMRNVIPGRYILVAVQRGWATEWRKPDVLAGFLAHGMPVEVKAGDKLRQDLQAVTP